MTYTDTNITEFNSLTCMVRPYEKMRLPIHKKSNFYKSPLFNSKSFSIGIDSPQLFENLDVIEGITDNQFIDLLNKIDKDYKYVDTQYPKAILKEKFSALYNEIVDFNFENVSVELTYDDALIFAIKHDDYKFLIQYYFDYNKDDADDIEIVFTDLVNQPSVLKETNIERIHSLLESSLTGNTGN